MSRPKVFARLVVGVAAAAVLLLPGSPATAATITVTGSIDPLTDPTAPQVAIISTPNCTGAYTAVAVHYDIIPLVARTTGDHTITDTATTSAIYVIEGEANPAEFATNCVAASNTNPINLTVSLTAGQRYDIVVIDDTFAQEGLDYQVAVTGDPTPAVGTADMAVALAAGAGPHTAGSAVGFTATITNGGPQDGVGNEVVLTLPAGFDPASIAAITADAGYTCTAGTGTLTCTSEQHPVGATATITFEATLTAGAAAGTYALAGTVTSETIEADPTDNSATVQFDVAAQATTTTTAPTTSTTTPPATGPVVAEPTFTG